MAFIAAAAITGGLAVAGGVAGGIMQGNATRDAAQIQSDAANHAADLQNSQYQQTRDDQAPYRQAGYAALGGMQDPSFQHDFSMADFQADPGYQFRMQQGQQAIERSAAARGGLQSAGTLKDITQFGQDMGSQEYQNAYGRFTNNQTNRFNRLASLAGLGQTANGVTAQAGMNAANGMGEALMSGANGAAGARIASGNMWGNSLSSLGSGIGSNVMQGAMINRMFPQTPGGGMATMGSVGPGSWAGSDVGALSLG